MALTPEEIREITYELKLQAQLQQEINGNYDSYINGLKKVKALDSEINRLTKLQAEISEDARASGRGLTDIEKEKLKILQDQTKELQLHLRFKLTTCSLKESIGLTSSLTTDSLITSLIPGKSDTVG